jgi:hypothetical protein
MKKLLLIVLLIGLLFQYKISAQFGDALLFDGTTGYISANSVSVSIGSAPNFSMEAWCYVTSGTSYPIIIAFNTTSGVSSNRNMIEFYGNQFDYYDNTVGSKYSSVVSMNAWHHVAAVFTSAETNNGFFYVDGVLQSTFTTNIRPDAAAASGQFSIGQEWDGGTPTQLFAGYIDEVRIWNIALTQSEIQTNMASEIPTNSVGLAAYYQMTDGSGTTLTDNSGNGHNGTLIGGVNFASPATPLPVELTAFTANISGSNVSLHWQTATEVNSYGFEVEKIVGSLHSAAGSSSPNTWVKIGFVQGSGNSNSPKEYSFVEANPVSGKSYYRLKMIDIDGSFEYSDIVEVSFNLDISTFELSQNYPNPFNPTTSIQYSVGSRQNVSLRVFDVLGNEIATLVNEAKEAGKYQVKFNASKLSSGIYLYKLQADGFSKMEKMLLVK